MRRALATVARSDRKDVAALALHDASGRTAQGTWLWMTLVPREPEVWSSSLVWNLGNCVRTCVSHHVTPNSWMRWIVKLGMCWNTTWSKTQGRKLHVLTTWQLFFHSSLCLIWAMVYISGMRERFLSLPLWDLHSRQNPILSDPITCNCIALIASGPQWHNSLAGLAFTKSALVVTWNFGCEWRISQKFGVVSTVAHGSRFEDPWCTPPLGRACSKVLFADARISWRWLYAW